MTYEKYLDYSREELLEKVRAVMSPKRFNHVLGVERAAIALPVSPVFASIIIHSCRNISKCIQKKSTETS